MTSAALIHRIFQKQIRDKFFSGAQVVLIQRGDIRRHSCAGVIRFDSPIPVTSSTMFDLASLTKPLCILPIFAWLIHRGMVRPEDPITKYLPDIGKPSSVKSLLHHRSGFPAYETFFSMFSDKTTYTDRKTAIIGYVSGLQQTFPDVYSDINYILLGFVLEEIFQKRLDDIYYLFLKEISYHETAPIFITKNIEPSSVAAASYSQVRKQMNHGGVEDENAWFLGGAAGHAGCFASAETVGKYLSFLYCRPWFTPFVTQGIGFDRPTTIPSAYGKHPKASLRGHLGYTGAAFLTNPDVSATAVLLTNRTHPTDTKPNAKERIRAVRQRIFDVLMSECL